MGKTFFGGVDMDGTIWVAHYNHDNSTLLRWDLHKELQYDSHCSPAILVRNDGRLVVFYTKHNLEQAVRYRISTNAGDITSWSAEGSVSIGGAVSYACAVQLSAEANKIYLFSRGPSTNTWSFATSLDGGISWSSPQALLTIVDTNNQYIVIASNGVDKIYFGHSGHFALEPNCSQYAFYYYNGNYYKTDGTLIETPLPLSRADMTLVYDAEGGGNYTGRIESAAFVDNIPYLAFMVVDGSSIWHYIYAKWNGAAWVNHEIENSGFGEGSINLDPVNPNTVYFPKAVDGKLEIKKAVTSDGGETWSITNITSGSAEHNHLPMVPLNRHEDLPVIWTVGSLRDEYASFDSYIISNLWQYP